jgi:hypothetical protein
MVDGLHDAPGAPPVEASAESAPPQDTSMPSVSVETPEPAASPAQTLRTGPEAPPPPTPVSAKSSASFVARRRTRFADSTGSSARETASESFRSEVVPTPTVSSRRSEAAPSSAVSSRSEANPICSAPPDVEVDEGTCFACWLPTRDFAFRQPSAHPWCTLT